MASCSYCEKDCLYKLELHHENLSLVAPEFPELLVRRYRILQKIYYSAPVGRRNLAHYFNMGERVLRREIEVLREQGLLKVDKNGVSLTPAGESAVLTLFPYLKLFLGLTGLEEELKRLLKVNRVIVVPGDLEQEQIVLTEIGRAAARILRQYLEPYTVLAVSGGTSCAALAEMLPESPGPRGVMVVPARGGLGEDVNDQANTIAAHVARKLRSQYRLLHLPDSLSEETLQILLKEERIKEVIGIINSAQVLVHGIGNAEEMARRRGASEEEIENLRQKGAVGEVFGLFFDAQGEIVERIPSLGFYLEELGEHINNVIVVAGGRKKAEAIVAVIGNHPRELLITDEGAARKILELYADQGEREKIARS